MFSTPQHQYLSCPECRFTSRALAFPGWITCPRCRARGKQVELVHTAELERLGYAIKPGDGTTSAGSLG